VADLSDYLRRRALDDWARWASCLALLACAVYISDRYTFLRPAFEQHSFYQVVLWDSQVFVNAGAAVAEGRDPYIFPAITVPFEQPFFSAPAVAATLGLLYSIFGPGLEFLLKLGHLAAVILAPLILTRTFIGRSGSAAAWGYGLFAAGIGGYGVTTIIAGNFGALLYLAIFAAMARGLSAGKWFWFHVALAVAVQVKPPYGLFWLVPILTNGWSWRQALHAAAAVAAAAAVFLVSYLLNPAMFREWLEALIRGVEGANDVGYSVYGATRRVIGMNADSILPQVLHVGMCAALFVFLLLDKTKGAMKAAALVAFAILANPRMKGYDVAFAVIPVAGLAYAVLVPASGAEARRAAAVGAITLGMIAWLRADQVPILGRYNYALAVAAGIVCLAYLRPSAAEAPPARPPSRT